LTQVPIGAAALIVFWFFAFSHVKLWRTSTPFLHNVSQLGLVCLTLVFLGCLFSAVDTGLLSTPDMQVQGTGSTSHELRWYSDGTEGPLPRPFALSAPLWLYRFSMLAWALWLARRLLDWMRWGYTQFAADGLWKKRLTKVALPRAPLGAPERSSGASSGNHPMRSSFYPNGYPTEQAGNDATMRDSDVVAAAHLQEIEPETRRISSNPIPAEPAPPSSLTAPTHLTFPEIQVLPQIFDDRMTLPNAELLRSPGDAHVPSPQEPAVRVVQLEGTPPEPGAAPNVGEPADQSVPDHLPATPDKDS
jgi:hypothetical protein